MCHIIPSADVIDEMHSAESEAKGLREVKRIFRAGRRLREVVFRKPRPRIAFVAACPEHLAGLRPQAHRDACGPTAGDSVMAGDVSQRAVAPISSARSTTCSTQTRPAAPAKDPAAAPKPLRRKVPNLAVSSPGLFACESDPSRTSSRPVAEATEPLGPDRPSRCLTDGRHIASTRSRRFARRSDADSSADSGSRSNMQRRVVTLRRPFAVKGA